MAEEMRLAVQRAERQAGVLMETARRHAKKTEETAALFRASNNTAGIKNAVSVSVPDESPVSQNRAYRNAVSPPATADAKQMTSSSTSPTRRSVRRTPDTSLGM